MFAIHKAASLFHIRALAVVTTVMASFLAPGVALAQTTATAQPLPEAGGEFASENAILDTSILFAIGAREARQELRGAFGWPTFQEGLVQGVYFRFDPDGYARFAPTPRLDSDVFEVICRPRTFSCMGRKGGLATFLNGQGKLQLRLENAAEGDRFYITDGIDELELPSRIVQPLDPQLELLLSSTDGELVIRRGDNEVERISLKGFGPVAAYLRWLTARQDYTVLPRGWPIPTSGTVASGVTQAAGWQSPMPQPQNLPIQGAEAALAADAEVAEVKGELRVLRELLLNNRTAGQQPVAAAIPTQPQGQLLGQQPQGNVQALGQLPAQMPAPAGTQVAPQYPGQAIGQIPGQQQPAQPASMFRQPGQAQAFPSAQAATGNSARLTALEQAADGLLSEIGRLRGVPQAPAMAAPKPHDMAMDHATDPALTNDIAVRLDYLMREIGLDAKTALMLVELGNRQQTGTPAPMSNAADSILAALKQDLSSVPPPPTMEVTPTKPAPMQEPEAVMVTQEEYKLLSQYFRSVLTPPAP